MKYLLLLVLVAACTAKKTDVPQVTEEKTSSGPAIQTVDFFSAKNGTNDGVQCPVNIVPGMFVGPLQVGMPKQNIFSAGMVVKQLKGSPDNVLVGPFMVTITDGKVLEIEVEPEYTKECLMYSGKAIAKSSTIDDLQKLFPNCPPFEARYGGQISQCQYITVKQGSGADAKPAFSVHK